MARQVKVGIDYFSHDVDMLQDRKVKLIKAKHGLIGYAVFLRLLEELYRDKGYYLHVDENFNLLFTDENNVDLNVYINVLNDCINFDLFDKEAYEKYSILTSKRIQRNYCEATLRRKEISFIKEYLILKKDDLKEIYGAKIDNVSINYLNGNIYSLNDDKSTQSKVKKSKVKNIKEKNINTVEQDSTEFINYIINYLNKATNKNFKTDTVKTCNLIRERLKEGYKLEDFIEVIDKKTKAWIDTDKNIYLRPETLFGDKFESYLQEEDVEIKGMMNEEKHLNKLIKSGVFSSEIRNSSMKRKDSG